MDFYRLYIAKGLLWRLLQQPHLIFDKEYKIYVNMLKLFTLLPIYK